MHDHGERGPHLFADTSLPQPSAVRQIDALQLLRAVAVILVVWCHTGQMLDASGSRITIATPPALSFANRLFFELSVLTAVMSAGLACYTFLEKPMLRFLQHKFLPTTTRSRSHGLDAQAASLRPQNPASDSAM